MVLPTFLGIGAARSGTTSLYQYLSEHPQVFMSDIKEVNFFSYTPTFPEDVGATTIEEYERLFARATTELARGEISPSYLTSPVAPARIHELLPDARIIAILRNPADRVFGAYRAGVVHGTERRTLDEALWPGPDAGYIRGALLHERLSRYFKLFDRAQIRIYRYEDLRNPETLYPDLFEFVGVDPNFKPATDTVYNRSWVPRSRAVNWVTRLNPVSKRIRRALPEGVKVRLRTLRRLNETGGPAMSAELRAELDRYFREDTERIQELTGLDLSDWLATARGDDQDRHAS